MEFLAKSGLAGILIIIFGLLVALIWMLVPFAVFSMRNRIDELVRLQRRSVERLDGLSMDHVKVSVHQPDKHRPAAPRPAQPAAPHGNETPIVFQCPQCHGGIEVNRAGAGRAWPCPHCGKEIRIPAA